MSDTTAMVAALLGIGGLVAYAMNRQQGQMIAPAPAPATYRKADWGIGRLDALGLGAQSQQQAPANGLGQLAPLLGSIIGIIGQGGQGQNQFGDLAPQFATILTGGHTMGNENTLSIGARLKSDLMRNFQLTDAQAAGVVGNLAYESNGFNTLQEIAPTVAGSRGGYGYAQWTGPRRRQFEAFASSNNLDPTSYAANYGFLSHELTSTSERRVLPILRAQPDAASAAVVFSKKFLRPGVPATSRRIALAKTFV